MVSIQLDMYGSTLTIADQFLQDVATRICLVSGLTADSDGDPGGGQHNNVHQAIWEVINLVGPWHQSVGIPDQDIGTVPRHQKLPLQLVTGRKWGPTKVWVTLRYFRIRGGLFGRGGNVQTTPGWESTPVYRKPEDFTKGLPTGNWLYTTGELTDPTKRPPWVMWKRAITKIEIPTALTFHPLQEVASLVNKINSDQITLGNISFAPYTLRFDGANVEGRFGTSSGINYFTFYHFTAIHEGHYRQFVNFNLDISVPRWEFANGLSHEPAPFFNAFPFNPQ